MLVPVDPLRPSEEAITVAASVINRGGLVAFPTETVYGLGASVYNEEACRRVFKVKSRPPDNPLIVHVEGVSMAKELAELPGWVGEVLERVWPGPLTFVTWKRGGRLPEVVTGGLETVAVRCPAHPVALELIRKSGVPIAAPSANKAGRPSPTTAEHVLEDLDGDVDLILDAGPTFFGIESTIVDVTRRPPVLLRPGPFTENELNRILGPLEIPVFARGHGEPRIAYSPGVKYKHYAPEKPVVLVGFSINEAVRVARSLGYRVGVLFRGRRVEEAEANIELGGDLYSIARNLFTALRGLDKTSVDVGLVEAVEEKGIGLAIMNRLRKACGGRFARDREELRRILASL